MGTVIRFAEPAPRARERSSKEKPRSAATVIILPVIRIERDPDGPAAASGGQRRRRRRRASRT
jgi:hypothetical protein